MDRKTFELLPRRFWAEAVLGGITAVLTVITPFWPDWIEAISGWDPDQHDGSVEWMIAFALFLITLTLLALARRDWRALVAQPSSLN